MVTVSMGSIFCGLRIRGKYFERRFDNSQPNDEYEKTNAKVLDSVCKDL